MAEQAMGLTLSRLARLVRRGWPFVLATSVVGAGGAYALSEAETPIYQSSASIYFSLSQGGSGSELNQGSAYTQAQILSFATLATSSITLNRVIDDLDLDISSKDLARNIEVTIPQNTVILDVTVSSRVAQRAADIANSLASNLSTVVVELAPSTDDQAAAVSARVIEPAVPPLFQSSPNTPRDVALGGILGLLLGAVGYVLVALLDTRVRSAEVISGVTEVPLLGQIGRFEKSSDQRPVMISAPNDIDAEAFRRVRAALPFTSVDQEFHAILVTSPSPREGKTTVAVNLALAFAETGASVLLMDADLRRPQVATALGLEGAVGLTTVLVGAVSVEDALRPYGSTNLDLLLSGDMPPNPAELLSSMAMAQVIADLSSRYDMVIVDSAPVLSVADASLLSPHVDLTLLVVDASNTRKAQLVRTVNTLEVAGAYISGIVLNRAKLTKKRDVYYQGALASGRGEKRAWQLRRGRRKPMPAAPLPAIPDPVAPSLVPATSFPVAQPLLSPQYLPADAPVAYRREGEGKPLGAQGASGAPSDTQPGDGTQDERPSGSTSDSETQPHRFR